MAWFGGGLCWDCVIEWIVIRIFSVETRYLASRVSGGIGVKYASNFGNPERFAKEKDAIIASLQGLPKKKTRSIASLQGLPKKKDAKYRVSTRFAKEKRREVSRFYKFHQRLLSSVQRPASNV
jgi:hypothetical protein